MTAGAIVCGSLTWKINYTAADFTCKILGCIKNALLDFVEHNKRPVNLNTNLKPTIASNRATRVAS